MRYNTSLVEARFVRRLNRFAAEFLVNEISVKAHVANSGRLGELLVPDARAWLSAAEAAHRKTAYDLRVMEDENKTLVSLDSRLPNQLFAEAFAEGRLREFSQYEELKPEVTIGKSRLDFQLKGEMKTCYVEVKSVTLVLDGTARFPDAPTLRGVKHLKELMQLVQDGKRGAVAFVIQRDDAEAFSPNDASDPLFGRTLRQAAELGVSVLAYQCRITLAGAEIISSLPVILD